MIETLLKIKYDNYCNSTGSNDSGLWFWVRRLFIKIMSTLVFFYPSICFDSGVVRHSRTNFNPFPNDGICSVFLEKKNFKKSTCMFLTCPSVRQSISQSVSQSVRPSLSSVDPVFFFFVFFLFLVSTTSSSETAQQNIVKLCTFKEHAVYICLFTGYFDSFSLWENMDLNGKKYYINSCKLCTWIFNF